MDKSGFCVPKTVEAMQEALIAWHELWWRSPGSGASPFAKDGPWHLSQREVGDIAGHYSLTLIENEAGKLLEVRKLDTPRPRTPLSTAEVDLRDWIGEMLEGVPEDEDRICLKEGTLMLWRGDGRISWSEMVQLAGSKRSPDGLRGRWRLLLAQMICRENGVPMRHARALSVRGRSFA